MKIQFAKMEGLGNDFIVMDDRRGHIQAALSYSELAPKLCHRRFGIGGDGIIVLVNSTDHDCRFRIFNCDGSEPEMCGNGMRCFAKYLYEKKIVTTQKFRVETLAGTVVPEVITDENDRVVSVCVDMGEPELSCARIPFVCDQDQCINLPLDLDEESLAVTMVSMGNPHAVTFVPDAAAIPLAQLGPQVETHPRFPEKTNVEFVQVLSDSELRMRVWERGAGITLACGTGACAAMVAAHLNGHIGRSARLHLDGGDLDVRWDEKSNHLFKTGPARLVFESSIEI
ncbi:MAG: diaminopimelate epimerase [Desulfovibrionales bacterium]|nr:diaminopimelate epimerase [Desulfovibrionales bacterium]